MGKLVLTLLAVVSLCTPAAADRSGDAGCEPAGTLNIAAHRHSVTDLGTTARVVVVVPILFWPFFFELPAVFFLGVWFLGQIFSGTVSMLGPAQVAGVFFLVFIGGFLAGILLRGLFLSRSRGRRGRGS